MFHFQLYRACSLIQLKPNEDLTPLLSNQTKEKMKNQTRVNFKDLAKGLQEKANFDETAEVTFMTEDKTVKKLVDLNVPMRPQDPKDLASLRMNFTTKRQRRSNPDLLNKTLDNETLSTRPRNFYMKLDDYEEPDLDYYSEMTVDDIQIETSVFMDSLKNSKYAHEGCTLQRLQPVDTMRALRLVIFAGILFLKGIWRNVGNKLGNVFVRK